jgi:hypothetical protein
MRATRIHVGDLVEVDVRGTVFPARVVGFIAERQVALEPQVRWCTYYSARLRDVKRRLEP